MFLASVFSFIAGVYIGLLQGYSPSLLLSLLFLNLAILPVAIGHERRRVAAILLLTGFLLAGMARGGFAFINNQPILPVTVKAVFYGKVTEATAKTAVIVLDKPRYLAGRKVLYMTEIPLSINGRVHIRGELRPLRIPYRNPHTVSWRWIKTLEGISLHLTGKVVNETPASPSIHSLRKYFSKKIERSEARYPGIVKALTIGDTTGIDERTREFFSRTGTSHILAISGSHIGIVCAFFFFLSQFLIGRIKRFRLNGNHRRYAALLNIPFAIFFMLVGGAGIPLVRATIMITIFMLSIFFGRSLHLMNTIALSALVILIVYPHSLFTASFQLTFLSVIAIVVVTERLYPLLLRCNAVIRWILSLLLITLAATIGTLPAVLYHFAGFNPLSILYNLVAVPLICILAMPLSFVGLVIPWGGLLIAVAGWIIDFSIFLLARFDAGYIYPFIRPTLFESTLYFGLLTSLLFMKRTSLSHFVLPIILSITLFHTGNVFYERFYSKSMKVSFIDVGLGDSILIEAPEGIRILLDGGGFTRGDQNFDIGKSVIAPTLLSKKILTLDYVINTHPHGDHLGGLFHIVKHFRVKRFVTGTCFPREPAFLTMFSLVKAKSIPFSLWKRGDILHLPSGTTIEVLNPPAESESANANDASLVFKITYGRISFLMTGDIGTDIEEELILSGALLASTVLKVPHHGSKYSSGMYFLRAVKPSLAVLSTGPGISEIPSGEALSRYEQLAIPLARTDRGGFIETVSDGKVLFFKTCVRAPGNR